MMYVCVYVADRNDLKLGTVVVLDTDLDLQRVHIGSRRRRRADVRAQAVVPLCPTLKYSTIHLQYKIKFLIQRFTTTSSSVQLCCEIINNILVVPRLI